MNAVNDMGETHHTFSHRVAKRKEKQRPGKCEWCGKDHDGKFGTGRFCSKFCKDAFVGHHNHTVKSPKVKAHLDQLRQSGKIARPRKQWPCKLCGFIANTRAELRAHYFTHCGVNDFSEPGAIEQTTCIHRKDGKYECAFCHKIFDKPLQIAGHLAHCKQHPLKDLHAESAKRQGRVYSKRYRAGKYPNSNSRHPQSRETIEKIMRTFEERQSRGDYAGSYKGIYYESSYELAWIVYNIDHGIAFNRCDESFEYYDSINGKWRLYFPDYVLPDGTIVEIKGYYTQNAADKMQAVMFDYHRRIILLEEQDLQTEISYCQNQYGKQYDKVLKDK